MKHTNVPSNLHKRTIVPNDQNNYSALPGNSSLPGRCRHCDTLILELRPQSACRKYRYSQLDRLDL